MTLFHLRSQAARQGLAVLLATALAVLKHETSTLRQRHNLYQLISNWAWVITLGRSPTLTKLVRVRWAVKKPRGVNIYGYCDFVFCFVFIFFNKATAHTREPIFAHNSSKDAVWCEENPFGDKKCVFLKFGGCFTLKTPLKLVEIGISSLT